MEKQIIELVELLLTTEIDPDIDIHIDIKKSNTAIYVFKNCKVIIHFCLDDEKSIKKAMNIIKTFTL